MQQKEQRLMNTLDSYLFGALAGTIVYTLLHHAQEVLAWL
jgi:hypothetical protein